MNENHVPGPLQSGRERQSTAHYTPVAIDDDVYPRRVFAECVECFQLGQQSRNPEVAALRARLAQAEHDADRYYRAAFDTPDDLRSRFDAAATEYWDEFQNGGAR